MKDTKALILQAASAAISLKDGGDEQAANQLRAYLRDAEDGLRRVLICGAYLDYLVSRLPHGTLGKWIAQHVPEISWRTVQAWRQLYGGVLESVGANAQRAAHISGGPVALLASPVEELPAEARELREKIDAQIAGKTARQLFLAFRSVDEDEEGNLRVKVGRRAGEGGRPPEPTETLAQVAARALRCKNKIARGLKLWVSFGSDFVLLDDHDLHLWEANLDAMAKAVRYALKTPKATRVRTPEVALHCDKILRGKA